MGAPLRLEYLSLTVGSLIGEADSLAHYQIAKEGVKWNN